MPRVNASIVLVIITTYRAIGELSPVLGLALLTSFTGGFAGGFTGASLYSGYTFVIGFVRAVFPSYFCPVSESIQCEKTFHVGAGGAEGNTPLTSPTVFPRIVVSTLTILFASLLSSAFLSFQKLILTDGAQTYATPL